MNEVRVYEETAHHIRQVHSVYVTLDGSTLRIQRPAQGVPKRALWSEQVPIVVNQSNYIPISN